MSVEKKNVTIKVPSANYCLSKLKRLLYWSAIKSFISHISIAICLSLIWHSAWPEPDNSLSFGFIGLVIFYIFVTSFYVLARAYFDIKEYKSKGEKFIIEVYIGLVKTGDIKPVLSEESN